MSSLNQIRSIAMTFLWLGLWSQQASGFELAPDVRDAIRGREYEKAISLLNKLTETGDVDAHYQLGSMYRAGQGVTKDNAAAFRHFSVAAKKGSTAAQYNLGLLYEQGRGTPQDLELARHWLQQASEGGHQRATARLQKPALSVSKALASDAKSRASYCRAVERGNRQEIERLSQRGLGPEGLLCGSETPLAVAAQGGHVDLVTFLLEIEGDPDRMNGQGRTPLMIAAHQGHDRTSAALVPATKSLNARDTEGHSALHFAAMRGLPETVKVLAKHGADLNLKTRKDKTALDIAISRANKEVVSALEAVGANRGQPASLVGLKNTNGAAAGQVSGLFAGWPQLHMLAWKGEENLVAAALTEGTVLDLKGPHGYTALGRAVLAGQTNIVRMLLSAGAPLDDNLGVPTSEIALAATMPDPEILRAFFVQLREQGSRPHHPDEAIGLLLRQERTEDARTLLELSSGYASKSKARAHMSVAAGLDNLNLLKDLAHAAGGIHTLPAVDQSPLHRAVAAGRTENVAWLLEQGAKINALSRDGNTALHLAAGRGHPDVVRVLVEGGSAIDQKNGRGNTPLAIAAAQARTESAAVLLDLGANPFLPNNKKERPEALVPATHPELAELIRSHRKKRNWLLEAL